MDILKEPFPEVKTLYDLDLYVNAILNLHADLDIPQFIEGYAETADQVEGKNPDLAAFLRKAETLWNELESKKNNQGEKWKQ